MSATAQLHHPSWSRLMKMVGSPLPQSCSQLRSCVRACVRSFVCSLVFLSLYLSLFSLFDLINFTSLASINLFFLGHHSWLAAFLFGFCSVFRGDGQLCFLAAPVHCSTGCCSVSQRFDILISPRFCLQSVCGSRRKKPLRFVV